MTVMTTVYSFVFDPELGFSLFNSKFSLERVLKASSGLSDSIA